MRADLSLADAFGRVYARIMVDDDKKPDGTPRDFPVEVKVGRTKVTVTLQLSPRVEVAVKETKIETEPESDHNG
jgi:hypothetical protein